MRLINVSTFEFEEYWCESSMPSYAILSHRWTDEEVSFRDLERGKPPGTGSSWQKVISFCDRVDEDGYKYAWIDTCCIDRSSSAELAEAINSMFKWYQNAALCYVYLEDVEHCGGGSRCLCAPVEDRILRSKWFTRCWTLQELLAPPRVNFFNRSWKVLGDRCELIKLVGEATGIPEAVLDQRISLSEIDVFTKISWIQWRETSRTEDFAYSFLGIFDVNIPLLYGEGIKALYRLQEEILKTMRPRVLDSAASQLMWYLRNHLDPSSKRSDTSGKWRASRIWSTFTTILFQWISSYKATNPTNFDGISGPVLQPLMLSQPKGSVEDFLRTHTLANEPFPAMDSHGQPHTNIMAALVASDPVNASNTETLSSTWNGAMIGSASESVFVEDATPVEDFNPLSDIPGSGKSEDRAHPDLAFDPFTNEAIRSTLAPPRGWELPRLGPRRLPQSKGSITILRQRQNKTTQRYGPQCESCAKTFTRARDLNRHVGDIHGQANNYYTCYKCEYRSQRKDKVMAHCRRKHSDYPAGYLVGNYHHGGLSDTALLLQDSSSGATIGTAWSESSRATSIEQPSLCSSPMLNPINVDTNGDVEWISWGGCMEDLPC